MAMETDRHYFIEGLFIIGFSFAAAFFFVWLQTSGNRVGKEQSHRRSRPAAEDPRKILRHRGPDQESRDRRRRSHRQDQGKPLIATRCAQGKSRARAGRVDEDSAAKGESISQPIMRTRRDSVRTAAAMIEG